MNRRMTLATAVVAGALLTACQGDAEPAPTQAPTVNSPTLTADSIVGTWSDPDADWTVHLEGDGTFTEDLEGQQGFRRGTYQVDGQTIRLIGTDGNTDEGRIDSRGEALVFDLGTLKQQ